MRSEILAAVKMWMLAAEHAETSVYLPTSPHGVTTQMINVGITQIQGFSKNTLVSI
jgi:hypothetical protein